MRKAIIAGASAILLAAIASFAGGARMKITSSAFQQAANIPSKFSCDGPNTSPPLQISDVPAEAKSVVLIVDDPDTQSGLFTHWAIWNIPATVTKIPQGTKALMGDLANAKQSGNYLSPCAQSLMGGQDDQYEFTIYALPTATLTVSGTSVANVLTALKAISPKPPTATLHGHSGLKGQ